MKGHWATDASDARIEDGLLTLEQHRRQQERARMERRARQAMRDMEYKAALGLHVADPLPKQIGAIGAPAPHVVHLRGTKRMAS